MRFLRYVFVLLLGAAAGWAAREYAGPKALDDLIAIATGQSVEPPFDSAENIKIASWNIDSLGQEKMSQPDVVTRLAEIITQFDVIAIQEIRSAQQDVLPRLVEAANAGGAAYDFVIGPRLGRDASKEQYAFLYNTARVEIDHSKTFTMADPADRLHREPLAALFRVRGPAPEQAFTFYLINVHTDQDDTAGELAALADALRAIRESASGEDDVILLGDLNAGPDEFPALAAIPNLTWAVSGAPTNVEQTRELDNILFFRHATSEFTSRAGVVDLEAQLEISRDDAAQLSDHLPVWAEFSAFEGGRAGFVTTLASGKQ